MTLEALLSNLRGVRHCGDGWVALCPAHADNSPSLSIRKRSGKLLIHCFAGCAPEAVCRPLGIQLRDLFSEHRSSSNKHPAIVCAVEQQIAKVRSRLTPNDRERPVAVVLVDPKNSDDGFARAL